MRKIVSVLVITVLMCTLLAGFSAQAEEGTAKAILVTSFGTSYNDSRDITIGAIEEAVAKAYPDYDVRRAFTSQIIIDKLKERDGLEIDNVEQAVFRLIADGVTEVIVQPTHLMHGFEYDDVVAEVGKYRDKFDKLVIAEPLLTSGEDFSAVIDVITSETADYDDGDTAVVFMGHGTEHASNAVYPKLQEMITNAGYPNYFIGTVEAEPSLEDVVADVEAGGYGKVVLEPLMVVAGDHANNDMAGGEDDSWKSVFEAAGYEVKPILRGLGEFEGIQDIYVQHVRDAIDSGAVAAEAQDGGAAATVDVSALVDGTYPITVDSSSNMFNIVDAQLSVNGGEMSAVLTLSGTGYEKLFMGAGGEAAGASDGEFIYFVEDADGKYTYEVPVTALDQDTGVAAFSIKKQEWYDRVLVFESASLPKEAFAA